MEEQLGVIEFLWEEKPNGTLFHIQNIRALPAYVLNKLSVFASRRRGFFNYESGQLFVGRRWNLDMSSKVFTVLEYPFRVDVLSGDNAIRSEVVTFGKYRGVMWKDVPSDYLQWVLSTDENRNWDLAHAELKKRERTASPEHDVHTTILFGKHKGKAWKDAPHEYLLWLRDHIEKDNPDLAFIEAAIAFQTNGK